MDEPKGNPLGWGNLGELLHRELKIGEQASVLDTEHIHPGRLPGGHIDARLYEKFPDGRIRELIESKETSRSQNPQRDQVKLNGQN